MPVPEISVENHGVVRHIRLNRPAKRNALTPPMYAAIADALTEAETDGTTIVLFSGAGAGFCAGNDMADFVADRKHDGEAPVRRFLRMIATSSRILVAAVHGNAIGVGTTMLFHCDFIIAEQSAHMRMPFVDLALVPEAASSLLVPQALGHHRAASLLLLGEAMGAEEAQRLGLVRSVVADGTCLDAARALTEQLAAKPRSALLATKRLMKTGAPDIAGRMAEESAAFEAQLQTPELAAIVANFFSTRSKVA